MVAFEGDEYTLFACPYASDISCYMGEGCSNCGTFVKYQNDLQTYGARFLVGRTKDEVIRWFATHQFCGFMQDKKAVWCERSDDLAKRIVGAAVVGINEKKHPALDDDDIPF